MTRPIDTVRSRLEGVQGSPEKFTARCPAHDDQHNSLSVEEARDGKVLLNCHAGCAPEDIVHAMGLQMKDLFPESLSQTSSEPLTIEALARAKKLPAELLKRVGVKQWR